MPEDFEVPFGKARIRRPGSDLSMITYGNTTHFCLSVAERLKKEHNWDVEVIDIRSLIPLDTETIFASVKKTGKVLIVHEDKVFSGFGAEIQIQKSNLLHGIVYRNYKHIYHKLVVDILHEEIASILPILIAW